MSSGQTLSPLATPTQVVIFDDAPRMPTLRIVLKTPTQKQKMMDALRRFFAQSQDSNNFNLLSQKEREEILKHIELNDYFSERDIQKLNHQIRSDLWQVFELLKHDLLKLLLVTEEDAPEVILAKMELSKQLVIFIKQLTSWMTKKLDEVLKIEDMEMRKKQTDDLFKILDRIMKDGLECDTKKDPAQP